MDCVIYVGFINIICAFLSLQNESIREITHCIRFCEGVCKKFIRYTSWPQTKVTTTNKAIVTVLYGVGIVDLISESLNLHRFNFFEFYILFYS